jgi:hypothetical protein
MHDLLYQQENLLERYAFVEKTQKERKYSFEEKFDRRRMKNTSKIVLLYPEKEKQS